jgi:hypothetical protein
VSAVLKFYALWWEMTPLWSDSWFDRQKHVAFLIARHFALCFGRVPDRLLSREFGL